MESYGTSPCLIGKLVNHDLLSSIAVKGCYGDILSGKLAWT